MSRRALAKHLRLSAGGAYPSHTDNMRLLTGVEATSAAPCKLHPQKLRWSNNSIRWRRLGASVGLEVGYPAIFSRTTRPSALCRANQLLREGVPGHAVSDVA